MIPLLQHHYGDLDSRDDYVVAERDGRGVEDSSRGGLAFWGLVFAALRPGGEEGIEEDVDCAWDPEGDDLKNDSKRER